jgi:hypothetical protein
MSAVWARAVVLVLAGCILAGLVFLYLWQGCSLASLRAARAQYTLEKQALERQRAYLEAKKEEVLGRSALERRARALGMCPFTPDRIIQLEDDPEAGP